MHILIGPFNLGRHGHSLTGLRSSFHSNLPDEYKKMAVARRNLFSSVSHPLPYLPFVLGYSFGYASLVWALV